MRHFRIFAALAGSAALLLASPGPASAVINGTTDTTNIYQKLQVGSRREAVARGHALGLLLADRQT